MTAVETRFRCMSPGCGHEYVASFDKDNLQERQCPKCRSNSVWRPPEKGAEEEKEEGGDGT